MGKKRLSAKTIMPKGLGQHHIGINVSTEMKDRLNALAEKYDRTNADMIRTILKVGIPMMEGLSQAEETMLREYVHIFRRLRMVRTLKEV